MGYKILILSLLSGFLAQTIKFIMYLLKNKKINFKKLVEPGGMPSSHSTSVTTLSTCVWREIGIHSPIFAVTLMFSLIVLYEAAGLRRMVGKQAETLNRIIEESYKGKKVSPERLQELLGHTPLEVIIGIILGIAFAFAFF